MKLITLATGIALLFGFGCSESKVDEPSSAPAPAPAHSVSVQGGIKFEAPAEWISERPASSMRQAQYRLPRAEGDPEDAEMAVFFFQGQGGSVQANIDRWVSQFTKADGRPADDLAKVFKKEAHGIPLTIVDVSGTYRGSGGPMMAQAEAKPDFRMIAAVAEHGSGPWFFKLTGPSKTIARWETSFQKFLDSIR